MTDPGSRANRSTIRTGVGFCLALVLIASCTDSKEPALTPSPTLPTVTNEDPGHYLETVKFTLAELDSFWRQEFPTDSQTEYSSPKQLIPYIPSSPPTSDCFITAWAGNAYYCSRDRTLYWDDSWLRAGSEEFTGIQTMVPVAVLAHEWGHHIQFLEDVHFASAVERELEADCYAGLFVAYAEKGKGQLVLESGDVRETLLSFYRVGDKNFQRSRWFDRDLHGGPLERTLAFAVGYITEDAEFCRAFEGSGPLVDLKLGPYVVTLLPSASPSQEPEGVVDVTNKRFPMYSMRLKWFPDLSAQDAADQLPQVKDLWFGDALALPLGKVEPFDGLGIGTSASWRYLLVTSGDSFHTTRGALFLHVLNGGGGLLIDVSTSTESDDWQQFGDYLFGSVWGIGKSAVVP